MPTANYRTTWSEHGAPAPLEKELISRPHPPLNVDGAEHGTVRDSVKRHGPSTTPAPAPAQRVSTRVFRLEGCVVARVLDGLAVIP